MHRPLTTQATYRVHRPLTTQATVRSRQLHKATSQLLMSSRPRLISEDLHSLSDQLGRLVNRLRLMTGQLGSEAYPIS